MKKTTKNLIYITIVIFFAIIIRFVIINYFFTDWNTYWINRFEERSYQLNKICQDKFGDGFILASQNPSSFKCCKSISRYPNLCIFGTETTEWIDAPFNIQDLIVWR